MNEIESSHLLQQLTALSLSLYLAPLCLSHSPFYFAESKKNRLDSVDMGARDRAHIPNIRK